MLICTASAKSGLFNQILVMFLEISVPSAELQLRSIYTTWAIIRGDGETWILSGICGSVHGLCTVIDPKFILILSFSFSLWLVDILLSIYNQINTN